MANVQGVRVCDQCDSTIPASEYRPSPDGRDLCPRCAAATQIVPQSVAAPIFVTAPAASAHTVHMYNHNQTKGVNGLGVAALILGILAAITCWIPLVGLLSLPLSGLGLLFAFIGFLVALIGRRSGVGMPISGGIVCVVAIVVAVGMTGAMAAAIDAGVTEQRIRADQSTAAATTAAESYGQNLSVSQVSVRKTSFGSPAVFGELTNNGDRVVTNVKATVYCLNASGRPVCDRPVTLLLAQPSGFAMRKGQPLKPGYSCKFGGFNIENAPSSWDHTVRVEIDEIEFADE